ncbi:hypothetical protein L1887_53033 [Cichorium endivia]|nr:hypothetical protein L1887_53033 [Cichorium endivia]
MPSWAKVELRLMGGMTAPVAALGSEPTWMALVEKPMDEEWASPWPLLWPLEAPLVVATVILLAVLGKDIGGSDLDGGNDMAPRWSARGWHSTYRHRTAPHDCGDSAQGRKCCLTAPANFGAQITQATRLAPASSFFPFRGLAEPEHGRPQATRLAEEECVTNFAVAKKKNGTAATVWTVLPSARAPVAEILLRIADQVAMAKLEPRESSCT